MLKIFIFIVLSMVTLQATPILKTGQSSSYNGDGDIVTDGSIKDDGYYQRGAKRDYTQNDYNVADNVTGLTWQDNNDTNTTQSTYNQAFSYCNDLDLNFHRDWRLPSIKELLTLMDYSDVNSSIDDEFRYVSPSFYWSSTTLPNDSDYLFYGHFFYGHSDYVYEENYYFVRCVRDGELDNLNFTRNDTTKTVSESVTNLQWQDDETVTSNNASWSDALGYCENLTLASKTDWRLPNQNELLSIVDYSRDDIAIDNAFENNASSYYWSSSSLTSNTTHAFNVHFFRGSTHYNEKSNDYYIRCVRGGQSGDLEPTIIVPLLKTGQTLSYEDGDDGDIQEGVARSYTRDSSKGIVLDNVTQLEWQDNINAEQKPWLSTENFNTGSYGADATGDTATNYCVNLELDGEGWRLPSIRELQTLVDYSKERGVYIPTAFEYISSSEPYWSISTRPDTQWSAWNINFSNANLLHLDKIDSYYVRCVRGEKLDKLDFTRDDARKIVTQSVANLQWQDNEAVALNKTSWSGALGYCADLTLADKTDWRLANETELLSILDYSKQNPSINSAFVNAPLASYWSSSTDIDNTSKAWKVSYYSNSQSKSNEYYVRCVRSETTEKINPAIITYLLN